MNARYLFLFIFVTCLVPKLEAQVSRLADDVQYGFSLTGTAGSGDNAPFWFTNNRYGLGATQSNSVLGRAYIQRQAEADSLMFWRIGYGLDVAGGYGLQSYVGIQQAFVDVQWKALGLSVGQKERPSELKNPELSTGGLVLGHNARPIPQVRFELPDFWVIPGTKGYLSIKGHVAYGVYTDNQWQRDHTAGTTNLYTQNSWLHTKAFFVRVGNPERFPLQLTAGLEMACQFKGTGYNVQPYAGGKLLYDIPLGGTLISSFIPGTGGDVNDDAFSNAAGNHIGSYHARLDWKARTWSVGLYAEHMFEDHSQMFLEYGLWKDMLLGVEVNLPKNPILSTLVYEHNGTMHQTGPIYHDATPENSLQISARDNYYFHHVYAAWQHGGYVMGNPTIPSPLYNGYLGHPNAVSVYHNRVDAHHVGLKGNPCKQMSWRALYTYEKNLGSYEYPTKDPLYGHFLLVDVTYTPKRIPGLRLTASYGHNGGSLLGTSHGGMLTIGWDGWIRKTACD